MRGEKWRVGMAASLKLDTLTPGTSPQPSGPLPYRAIYARVVGCVSRRLHSMTLYLTSVVC